MKDSYKSTKDMELSNDFDRVLYFEHARRTAEAAYAKNPNNADYLTRWGGALLELSRLKSGPESKEMVQEAIDKLEKALDIDPCKHDALWCIGNAYTSNAFFIPDFAEASGYFDKAMQCFELAFELVPTNALYKKSLELASKAPELHVEILKHGGLDQQTLVGGSSTSSTNTRQSTKKSQSSDLKYDIFGWVILVGGFVTWIGLAFTYTPLPK